MDFIAIIAILAVVYMLVILLGIVIYRGADVGKWLVRNWQSPPATITGRAYVTDGDGLRVSGYEIRLAALDAPEYDQRAMHRDGYWFNQGKRIKSALIKKVAGKHLHVEVMEFDKYGRAVGIATCDGMDVGWWLVRNGHAIAVYGDRYKRAEREARLERRGMWDCAVAYDPRAWRHGERKRLF